MGKIRKRKKWIAKPTEFSEALRLARTKHRGFTPVSYTHLSSSNGIACVVACACYGRFGAYKLY